MTFSINSILPHAIDSILPCSFKFNREFNVIKSCEMRQVAKVIQSVRKANLHFAAVS